MTIAIILMGGLGLIVGVGLAIASKVFYVWVDPKIEAVEAELPGANCGGCGYAGCGANAEAIVAGKSPPSSCVAAGPEVAQAIAIIMGVSVESREPDFALPGCTYGLQDADVKFLYDGLNDCRAAALLSGGMKVCHIGCLGLGTCAKACPFDAITMSDKGLPVVDESKCTGCGTCERVCPKHIITLSSVTRRILKEYTTEDCTTPCQRACPAGINISGYIGAVAQGDYDRAVQIIKERNPFPTVIGRICPRPCEDQCRRQYVDEPVAINFIKRYAADVEMASGKHVQPYKAPPSEHKLAIIGGGIQGLSAAFFAARLGHEVTVFESGDQMGGLLRSAIADYRLPLNVLDWDIEGIAQMGVTMETGKTLGRDLAVAELFEQGYEAVFLAVGGWDSRLARTGGRGDIAPVPGCHLLIDAAKAGQEGYPELRLDGHVVIVGAPDLKPALIERCRELGAQKITVLVRETSDVDTAKLQGVEVASGVAISRLFGSGNQLKAVALLRLADGVTESVEVDHLLFTSGRIPELVFTPTTAPDWEAFPPYKQPAFHHEIGLLSKGDILTDFQAAIKAIAAGRRAAVSLHKALYDLPLELPEHVVYSDDQVQNVDRVFNVPSRTREIMPLATTAQTVFGQELEKGFTTEQAKKEADRCLRCGLICYLREKPIAERPPGAAA